MADVPVGALPSPTAANAPAAPVVSGRAAKLAAVNAGLAKLASEQAAPVAPTEPAAAPVAPAVEPAKAPEAEPAKVEPDAPKAEPVTEDKPDPQTTKALAAIDKQAKKFRDEQAAAKAEIALERAELARLKAEVTGKSSSFEELQALARRNPIAALEKLGIESEDDWEAVGRGVFPRTKTGKTDPRTKAAADQTVRERELSAKLDAQDKAITELREQFSTRDRQAQTQAFITRYLDDAVKSIPTEPTLIGKLHAKAPDKARQALLEIGARLEKANDGEAPPHAEVIAEYERARRAELEDQGVDVDALLKPAAKAAPVAMGTTAPTKTLDVTSSGGTRPINGIQSRAEKLAAVTAGLKKLDAAAT